MKKYTKPALFCERLELVPVILNACNASPTNHGTGDQCVYEIPGIGTVFSENVVVGVCDYTGMDDLVCYHNPESAENIIFGS